MKWESVYWENTHIEGKDGQLAHVGMVQADSGQRWVALRLGSDGDGQEDKSITILLDDDAAEGVIDALKMTARTL